jgi:hypothetical protein
MATTINSLSAAQLSAAAYADSGNPIPTGWSAVGNPRPRSFRALAIGQLLRELALR